jgi:hypothetical protein
VTLLDGGANWYVGNVVDVDRVRACLAF